MAQLKKILLVDDDDDLREALGEQLLMTEDFDVFEADDGASAMVKGKEQLYDLMILDVGLPDTDGRELCRMMRKQGVKYPQPAAHARAVRRRDFPAWAIHVQACAKDACHRRRQESAPDGKGNEHPEVPVPRNRWRGRPRRAFARRLTFTVCVKKLNQIRQMRAFL